jgi:hypothetical protein
MTVKTLSLASVAFASVAATVSPANFLVQVGAFVGDAPFVLPDTVSLYPFLMRFRMLTICDVVDVFRHQPHGGQFL